MGTTNEPKSSSGEPETEANKRIRLELEKTRFVEDLEVESVNENSDSKGFRSTKLGQRWTAIESRLKKTRLGKVTLVLIYVIQFGALLAALIFWRPMFDALSDLGDPAAYKLSEAQIAEGYDRTCSGSGKTCSVDNVYYRFHTEDDQAAGVACAEEYAWCVLAIPREDSCEQMTMVVNTFSNDGPLEPAVETITAIKNAPDGSSFEPGEIVLLGVIPDKENSEYASVKELYCYQK